MSRQNPVTLGFLTPNWKSIIPKKSLQWVISHLPLIPHWRWCLCWPGASHREWCSFQVVSSPSELCFQKQYLKSVQKLTGIKCKPRVQVLCTFSDAQFTLETSCNSLRCSLLESAFQISNSRSNKGNEEGKDLHLLQGHWDCAGRRSSQVSHSNPGQRKSSSTLWSAVSTTA